MRPVLVVGVGVYSEEEIAQAKDDADHDIAIAQKFIDTMITGIEEFQFFNPDTDRRTKIATLAQVVEMAFGPGGAVIMAAVAIEALANKRE